MSDYQSSFVRIGANEVKKMAIETLEHIKFRREQQDKKYITKLTAKRNRWRKFFRLKLLTEEQVTETLNSIGHWPYYPSMYLWRAKSIAERLIVAADTSNDGYVLVSTDDLMELKMTEIRNIYPAL